MDEAKAGAIFGKCTPGVSLGCQAMAKVPRPGAVHLMEKIVRSFDCGSFEQHSHSDKDLEKDH